MCSFSVSSFSSSHSLFINDFFLHLSVWCWITIFISSFPCLRPIFLSPAHLGLPAPVVVPHSLAGAVLPVQVVLCQVFIFSFLTLPLLARCYHFFFFAISVFGSISLVFPSPLSVSCCPWLFLISPSLTARLQLPVFSFLPLCLVAHQYFWFLWLSLSCSLWFCFFLLSPVDGGIWFPLSLSFSISLPLVSYCFPPLCFNSSLPAAYPVAFSFFHLSPSILLCPLFFNPSSLLCTLLLFFGLFPLFVQLPVPIGSFCPHCQRLKYYSLCLNIFMKDFCLL